MSWQEKVDRYIEERKQQLDDVARAEREAKLRKAQEKVPPLIEALNKLPIRQLLTEIRNGEWKLGGIHVNPQEITLDTPIRAEMMLSAAWLRGREGYESREDYADAVHEYKYIPAHTFREGARIGIGAEWSYYLPSGQVWTNEEFRSITNHIRYPRRPTLSRFDFSTEKGYVDYEEDKRRTEQYVREIEDGKIKEGVVLDGSSNDWSEDWLWDKDTRYSRIDRLRFDDLDIPLRIESWLLEISVARRENGFLPELLEKQGKKEIRELGLSYC